MRPLSIEIENFLGIKHAKVDFRQGVFLIVGQNGAGKSSLLEAMVFALYGSGIRYGRQSPRNYVRDGSRYCQVSFTFLKNGKKYQVLRRISEGNDKSTHQAKLMENDRTIATQRSSVDAMIQEIIGASLESFTSTFFLPQGMAAELLTATWTKIEEVIFDVVFPKRTIKTVLEVIAQRFQDVKTAHEVRQSGLLMVRKQLEELKTRASIDRMVELEKRTRELDELLSKLESEYETLKKAKELWIEIERLDAEITVLRNREKQLKEKAELDRKISMAKQLEPAYLKYKAELELFDQASQEGKKIQDKMNRTEVKLQEIGQQMEKLLMQKCDVEQKYDGLRKMLDKLQMIRQSSESLVQNLLQVESESAKLKEYLGELERKILRLEQQIKHKNLELTKTSETLEALTVEINSMNKIAILKMASMIAQHLSEGDICPVCGNEYKEHPLVAGEIELGIYEKKVTEGELLKNKMINIESELQSLRSQHQEIVGDAEKLKRELQERQERASCLRAELEKAGYYPQLVYDIDKLSKQLEMVLTEKTNIERQLSGFSELRKNLEESLRELQTELTVTLQRLKSIEERAGESEKSFYKLLDQSGLTLEDFQKLRLMTVENAVDQLRDLQIKLADCEHKKEMLMTQVTLSQEECSAKIAETREKIQQIRNQRDRLINEKAVIQHTLEMIEKLEKERTRLEVEFEEIHRKYEVYSLVKSTFGAKEFQAYVAKIALESILTVANHHLNSITEGRFQLGIGPNGFLIYDFGSKRDANGLSGGEKTVVSLALAIAMAEATIGEMEAFFVDEGFSSLDSENKSKLASVLKGLERLNKVIGFVTHDPEFAEYFSTKLLVEKGGVMRWT